MTKQQLREAVRTIIRKELNEGLRTVPNPNAGKWRIVTADKKEKPLTDKFYDSKAEAEEASRKMGKTNAVGIKFIQLKDTMQVHENAPAPSKPKETPGPAVAPGKPEEKKPRRPLGNPNVKPQPKATMKEAEMLKQVIKRFRSKETNEGIDDIAAGAKPFSNFSSADQLLQSISGRLITASQMQDWNLVDEIAMDVYNFIKNK